MKYKKRHLEKSILELINYYPIVMVMEIIRSFQDWPIKPSLYHFRTYSGAEVALILELNGILYPIEIKKKSNPSKKDIKGFESFKECFPNENINKGQVICSVEKAQHLSQDVLAIPWTLIEQSNC